jgi:acetolactate synthase-1/2/3 large subunit
LERANDLPILLDEAIEVALSAAPGPAVLLVAKDLQRAEAPATVTAPERTTVAIPPDPDQLSRAVELLDARPVVIIAGADVSRSKCQDDLSRLAARLDATVATTPDARDAFDNRDPRYLGVSGAMGHPAVVQALRDARLVLIAGTSLPILARQGLESMIATKTLLSIGRHRPFVSGVKSMHLGGALSTLLRALTAALTRAPGGRDAPARGAHVAAPESLSSLSSASILKAVERVAPAGSVVLVDAGNTGASAVHYLGAPRQGRWLLAMGMAGMGYAFGGAIGAAFATGRRCIVVAGDGAFFMHGLEIHTAVEHALPITYVILNNSAHGMCLVRERLLLGQNTGYNVFRRSNIGAGLAAMFPGLSAFDCESQEALEQALARSLEVQGPSVVCAALHDVEIPPFAAFQERAPSAAIVKREVDDGDDDKAATG